MRLTSSFVTLSLLSVAYASATVGPVGDICIVNKFIQPDGFNRSAVVAGKDAYSATMPGPLVIGRKGDYFSLNVIDKLTDTTMLRATSIHWHGLFQHGSAWADGPVGVTQCPIAPGHAFDYKFTVPDQAGTFWYHSHYSTQYCDGLRGGIVIYDPKDPHRYLYDIDDENTVISLTDWYHVPAPAAGAIPTPDATLINGLGRYVGGPNSPLAIVDVKRNKRYRMRLINMSCDPNYTFSIDGHKLTVIEADGINTKPLTVDSIQIFAGQRYSFILKTDQPVDNYWIRANPNIGSVGFANGLNSAILRYKGAPEADPSTSQGPNNNPLRETDLRPLSGEPAPGIPQPGAADVNINLNIQLNFTDFRFYINGATFIPPTVPVLLQILSGVRTAQQLLPAGSVYTLPRNKVIELTMPGGSPGSPHPIHLHGHAFDVVRSAGTSQYNFKDPVKRDVVSIGGASDNVTIRFRTDNPGPWILHCHIDWHLEGGLAVVFAEDVDSVASFNPPNSWDELCPIFDVLPPEF
ncbi:multicopper oxidase [Amanita thiersii Skay4041]|uniref:Multicopper oxidase n=1 Tax=Amanita thiersii Skay4041 TaxID=703135 RepID=A0A2A9NET1_9AGAR|nr:multicopper oxidase [Amanita thiersii Skay4041]